VERRRLHKIEAQIAALAPAYLERRAADVVQLREARARSEWTRIGVIGHDLRGTGASFGFSWISEIGGELEAAAERRDADHVARLTDRLEAGLVLGDHAAHTGQRRR
jgi:Hpt domain-containing protein